MRLRYWSPRFEIGPMFLFATGQLLPRYNCQIPAAKITTRSKNLRVLLRGQLNVVTRFIIYRSSVKPSQVVYRCGSATPVR